MTLWVAAAGLLAIGLQQDQTLADVSVREVKDNGRSDIVMENPFVRLTIDLRHGGRVTGFLNKQTGHEWVGSGQGLFADHVWQQTWPGELYDAPYEGKIEKTTPEEAAVTVTREIQGVGQKDIAGVRIERTLRLRNDSPAVEAVVKLVNGAEGPRSVGYWSQHLCSLGGPEDNYYLRPSARGLSVALNTYKDNGRQQGSIGEEWVKDPVAGWTAAINPKAGEAAVFLMDYNDLRWQYNCISVWTTEWYYDLLRMTPGREWTTRIVLLPLLGYRGITHASEKVVVDLGLRRQGKGFAPVYTLGCGAHPMAEVTLRAELLSLPSRARVAEETIELSSLTFKPQERVSTLNLTKARGDFALRVHVSGAGVDETFERVFERKDLSDHLVARYPTVTYRVTRPLKKKNLPRPDSLALKPHTGIAVLELRGMFYTHWRLKQALERLGDCRVQPSHFVTNVYGDRLDYFPSGYEEMSGYDLVALENIPLEAIGDEGLAMLKDYVEAGGGLLVGGGWHAFGGGSYAGSVLEELLPVKSASPPDVRWQPKGFSLRCDRTSPFGDVPAPLSSYGYWYQQPKSIKPNAIIAIRAGDHPFLVLSSVGKGRVACLLGAPCGAPPPGQTGFWDDPEWATVLAATVKWLRPTVSH